MAGLRDDLIKNVQNTVAGIPSALMSGGIGAGFGFLNNLMQNMFQRRLLKQQFEYQQKAFEAENLRQDYLMANSASIQKKNLKNAGYSTADPNGTGVTTPNTSNMATPNMQFQNAGDMGMAEMLNRNALLSAQIENIKADTADKQADADKKEEEKNFQVIVNELKRKYGDEEYQKTFAKMDAETQKFIAERDKALQDKINSIALTQAQVDEIDARIDIAYQKLPQELQLIVAQTFKAEEEGKLAKAKAAEAYQMIKESAQRIENMKKEYELTDAQIALVQAEEEVQKALKDKTLSEAKRAEMQARQEKIHAEAMEKLGPKYYAVMKVVSDVNGEIERTVNYVGNGISSFIPMTDKVESVNSGNSMDAKGNMSSYGNVSTITRTRSRGK